MLTPALIVVYVVGAVLAAVLSVWHATTSECLPILWVAYAAAIVLWPLATVVLILVFVTACFRG